ncbi:MAG: GIY-YIG nuclease family protein [Opitutaceae bacterium]
MHYVYILRSTSDTNQTYVGYTADLQRRIAEHNSGNSSHTKKFTPWELLHYSAFPEKNKALAFEAYLKSHSGKAFAAKRLIDPIF